MINIQNLQPLKHIAGFLHTTGGSMTETNPHPCNTFPVTPGTLTDQRFTGGSRVSLKNSGFTRRGLCQNRQNRFSRFCHYVSGPFSECQLLHLAPGSPFAISPHTRT